ncbi:unnamed protein product [Ilex paraguariensis]|uniref:Uncharacterized protein n=1 Tax=Ilex paraguariensis TaxID=185542 RepID=A0ABC8SM59_9AQUA
MGGCASKPNDLDGQPAPLPVPADTPDSPKNAEGETVPQDNNNGGEDKKDEPLVNLSEPASEAPKVEDTEAATVVEESKPSEVTSKPTEEKVEAQEPTKEEKKEVADVVAEKPEVLVAAPKAEDKSDAPLVLV